MPQSQQSYDKNATLISWIRGLSCTGIRISEINDERCSKVIDTLRSVDEIDRAIAKLRRRIGDLEQLDVEAAVVGKSGEEKIAISNLQTTILEVFGENSHEYQRHRLMHMWVGTAMKACQFHVSGQH